MSLILDEPTAFLRWIGPARYRQCGRRHDKVPSAPNPKFAHTKRQQRAHPGLTAPERRPLETPAGNPHVARGSVGSANGTGPTLHGAGHDIAVPGRGPGGGRAA